MDDRVTEFELIDLLAARTRRGADISPRVRTGIGDDAAVTDPGGLTATSVDAVVEGVHFRREWSPPEAIAHKAVGSAMSDLAAMAAGPGEIYVTLGLPPDTDRGWLEALAEAFALLADGYGAVLTGGDTVASPTLFISVTVVGHASRDQGFVLRSGAGPDEVVAVTGSLGGAAAGFWLLEHGPEAADGMEDYLRKALIDRQLRPDPRLVAGLLLGRAGATAMVDLSDGLAPDLGHIARASGVAIGIDTRQVPVQPGVPEVIASAGVDVSSFVLAGGEDYELAVTIPEDGFPEARDSLMEAGLPLTRIGRSALGKGVTFFGAAGPITLPDGFDHLS